MVLLCQSWQIISVMLNAALEISRRSAVEQGPVILGEDQLAVLPIDIKEPPKRHLRDSKAWQHLM